MKIKLKRRKMEEFSLERAELIIDFKAMKGLNLEKLVFKYAEDNYLSKLKENYKLGDNIVCIFLFTDYSRINGYAIIEIEKLKKYEVVKLDSIINNLNSNDLLNHYNYTTSTCGTAFVKV